MPDPVPDTLDVRPLPPSRTVPVVLAAFDRLQAGESFILVDDHNPTMLRSRIVAARPGQTRWLRLSDGPRVWHVRVERRNG